MEKVEVQAVRGISLEIKAGEFVAIMGPSGSGKSTLMHIVGCLDKLDRGSYIFEGTDISKLSDDQLAYIRNQKIGFVFQTFNLLARTSALKNVELPTIYGNFPDRERKVRELLESVNLADRMNHKRNELSGGQQQRVAIARSLVNDPSLLVADEPTGNLDSHSEKEIMDILTGLNRKGLTIVLVTHEQEISACAKRIIYLRDGRIVSDETRKESVSVPSTAVFAEKPLDLNPKKEKSILNLLELRDSVRMAVDGLLTNKLRSFLTMLGIIIGVAAVISMISIVQGAKSDVTNRIQGMGSNLLMVYPVRWRPPGTRAQSSALQAIKMEDVDAIMQEVDNISKIDPEISGNAQVVYGDKNTNTHVYGTSVDMPAVRNFTVAEGEFFDAEADMFKMMVAVLGPTVVINLFDEGDDPVGKYIKINRKNFLVVGVMKAKGSSTFMNEDDSVYVPLSTAMKRLYGNDKLSNINIQVSDTKYMESAQNQITELLRQRHSLVREDQENDFEIRSQQTILETVEATTKTFSLLLGGIAAVSLLVGGIGIMNIMLVSVTERTREIGIRKAVGAKRKDIMTQFLIEAIVISVIGGLIGMLGGLGGSKLIGAIGHWTTVVSLNSILLSFGFAFVVGIVFGLYPARKASYLDPIEALRFE